MFTNTLRLAFWDSHSTTCNLAALIWTSRLAVDNVRGLDRRRRRIDVVVDTLRAARIAGQNVRGRGGQSAASSQPGQRRCSAVIKRRSVLLVASAAGPISAKTFLFIPVGQWPSVRYACATLASSGLHAGQFTPAFWSCLLICLFFKTCHRICSYGEGLRVCVVELCTTLLMQLPPP